MNLYNYGANNPVSKVDHTGLQEEALIWANNHEKIARALDTPEGKFLVFAPLAAATSVAGVTELLITKIIANPAAVGEAVLGTTLSLTTGGDPGPQPILNYPSAYSATMLKADCPPPAKFLPNMTYIKGAHKVGDGGKAVIKSIKREAALRPGDSKMGISSIWYHDVANTDWYDDASHIIFDAMVPTKQLIERKSFRRLYYRILREKPLPVRVLDSRDNRLV